MTENCKPLYLMEMIVSKGKRQEMIHNVWKLDNAIQKVVKYQAKIMNPRVEVMKDNALIDADLLEEIEMVMPTGLCSSNQRTLPLAVMIGTPDSEERMSGKATGKIESAHFDLVDPVTVKVTIIIRWEVLITKEKECCSCQKQSGFYERTGELIIMSSGTTDWEDVSPFETVSFIVFNSGPVSARLFLEGSPNRITAFKNTPLMELAPQLTFCLVPKFFTRYLRLGGTSNQKTRITYWIQAQY